VKRAPGLFAALLALLILLGPRRAETPAGVQDAIIAARHLVRSGNLDIATEVGVDESATAVHRGHRYARAPLGEILALAPAELVGWALGVRSDAGRFRIVAVLLESLSAQIAIALVALILARRLGSRAVVWLVVASGLWAAARVPDGEAWAALALLTAREGLDRGGRGAALMVGLGGAGALLIDPGLSLVAIGFALLVVGKKNRAASEVGEVGEVVLALVPVALALIAQALYAARFSADPAGSWSRGLQGLLLSTGKSVFLYTPLLLLLIASWASSASWQWRWQHERTAALVDLVAVLGALALIAPAFDWFGGVAFGPRRLVPLLPLLLESSYRWVERRKGDPLVRIAFVALIAAGVWVQLLGTLFSPVRYDRVASAARQQSGAGGWFVNVPDHVHFIPQFSPLGGHYFLLQRALGWRSDPPWKRVLPSATKVPLIDEPAPGKAQSRPQNPSAWLDFWWLERPDKR
jgi:hypothetical protein